jgi:hypothetical protein
MRSRFGKCGELGVGDVPIERVGGGAGDGGIRETRDSLRGGVHRLSSMDGNFRAEGFAEGIGECASARPHIAGAPAT